MTICGRSIGFWLSFASFVVPISAGCILLERVDPDGGPPQTVCNDDGLCDSYAGENPESCPGDCVPACELDQMTGPVHEFIVHELFTPTTHQEAHQNGVDLDGDGTPNNKLGEVTQLLMSLTPGAHLDVNEAINEDIHLGRLLIMVKLRQRTLGDHRVTVETFPGAIYDATPVFDGADEVLINEPSPADAYLCGDTTPMTLLTAPFPDQLYFPVFAGREALWLIWHRARVETVSDPNSVFYETSHVDAASWSDVIVGGGLTREQIANVLLPTWAQHLYERFSAGEIREYAVGWFDGKCSAQSDVPGCENVTPGQGPCDNTQVPPVITKTEILCSSFLQSAFEPDVDIDGDGVPDLLSVGHRIASAVPVTIVE